METIKLTVHIDGTGVLKLETPTLFKDIETEIILILNPLEKTPKVGSRLPDDFFAKLDAIVADDVVERPEQGEVDIREPFE